jgi:hypothetical protein
MPSDLLANSKIRPCQVEAGLTGSGMTTERHNEDIFGFDGSQGSPANLARLEHGQRMTQIESLSLGETLGSVINRQSRDESVRPNQAKHLLELHDLGTYTQAELAELFGVGRYTIYRTLERMRPAPPGPERTFAHLENPQTTG